MRSIKTVLAENIRRIRKSKKMTQDDLAYKVGIDLQSIAAIEQSRSWPTLKNVEAIAQSLNVTEGHLFIDQKSKPKPEPLEVLQIVVEALQKLSQS